MQKTLYFHNLKKKVSNNFNNFENLDVTYFNNVVIVEIPTDKQSIQKVIV